MPLFKAFRTWKLENNANLRLIFTQGFWWIQKKFNILVIYRLQNGCVTRLVCWWAFGCSSPCAFNLHRWLASCSQHRERESRVSVFPCQYIAYPQQVLCSAFSWLQVSMGAARPQNQTARAKLAWPNGRAGGGGQKSQRLRKRTRSSLAIG